MPYAACHKNETKTMHVVYSTRQLPGMHPLQKVTFNNEAFVVQSLYLKKKKNTTSV